MKFTTLLFDFDGTLVDSMPTWIEKMVRILKKEGIRYSNDLIKTITPLGDVGTAIYFRDMLGVKLSIEEMLDEMDSYAFPEYQNTIPLKEGVAEYLTLLKRNNRSLNVLTASPRKMLIPCLKRNGIYGLFDNVWSCDDFGKTKSDTSIYNDVISKLGSNPEKTAFFDDNVNTIRTAKVCDLYTVGVYDESCKEFADEMKKTADLYINSFLELQMHTKLLP